jgi:hypothetical protein
LEGRCFFFFSFQVLPGVGFPKKKKLKECLGEAKKKKKQVKDKKRRGSKKWGIF